MSPRIAGVGLLIAGVVVGAWAGGLLATPPWGVPAAFLLAGATIIALVGVLWMLRRSWADRTWPPAPLERPEAERARRSMLILGIILTATAPLLAGSAVALTVFDGDVWAGVRFGVFGVLYLVGGIAFLRAGLRRTAPVDETREPAASAAEGDGPASSGLANDVPADAGGWRAVGRVGGVLFVLAGPSLVFAIVLSWQLFGVLDAVSGPVLVGALFVLAAAVVAAIIVLRRRASAVMSVHVGERRIRVRDREAAWSDVVSAEVRAASIWPGAARTLVLLLATDDGLKFPVTLRRTGRLGLSLGEQALVEAVVADSRIEIPRAKEDPMGKFSRTLFPAHVTKDEALDLVRDPPGTADPLPVGPRV